MRTNSTGSWRKTLINNISFRTKSDIDATEMVQYEKEAMATSGDAMMKYTKKTDNVEGVNLATNSAEFKILKQIHDRTGAYASLGDAFPIQYQQANGTVRGCTGDIIIDGGRSTAEGTVTVMFVPMVGKWETL